MRDKRHVAVMALLLAVPGWLAWLALIALLALAHLGCVPADRVAGSSTEAGNATGKLSLKDGTPAEGVSVALVAPDFIPDTTGVAAGDLPGRYYRVRTDSNGRFLVPGVVPGRYRVLAIGRGIGAMVESVTVAGGADTAVIERTLTALGAVNGNARFYGAGLRPVLWVKPKATLKQPPIANDRGAFRLDSLPEGEYELIPECMSCAPARKAYRVRVLSGSELSMDDTLRFYPQMFSGFPDSGYYEVPAGTLPASLGGKLTRGDDFGIKATRAEWTWNGIPIAAADQFDTEGLLGTGVTLDSSLFGTAESGRLRVILHFPDTVLSRAWTVKMVGPNPAWPLQAVEADRAERINGPLRHPRWRFRVVATRQVEAADVAFWNLQDKVTGAPSGGLPEWIPLDVDVADTTLLKAGGGRLTFLLVPGGLSGAGVFRPRRDERLQDLAHIRLFDRSRMGFADSLVPTLLPEGLHLERARKRVRQAYAVDLSGQVRELLGPLSLPGRAELLDRTPLLFWRTGPADSGFDWRAPMRGAVLAMAVTHEGRAYRLDVETPPVDLTPASLQELESLLAPLDGAPPALRDTATPASGDGGLEYLRFGSRGILRGSSPDDSLLAGLKAWMVRAGLESQSAFPLRSATWRFRGFALDPDLRYTGDTVVLELVQGPDGTRARESLSPGSPGRLTDTLKEVFTLYQEGDSLKARAETSLASSRLFGKIDGTRTLFPISGLQTLSPRLENGLPVLDSDGNILAGRLDGYLVGWGKVLASPGFLLDGREMGTTSTGLGFLHTREGGLERAWRFGGRDGSTIGWDRL